MIKSFVSLCLFCWLSFGLAADQTEIVSYARQSRLEPTLSIQKEQERLVSILVKINQTLPHYIAEGELIASVKNFVNDYISSEIGDSSHFTIIDVRTTEFYGKSHDIVFLVLENDKIKYVVKAFQNPCQLTGRFLAEISAMDLIQTLALPGIVPVQPIAFAICHEGNNEWGFLLETAAIGQRVDGFLYDKSEGCFEIAKTVFRDVGASMALLHSIKSNKKLPLHPNIITNYDDKFRKLCKEPLIIQELSKICTLEQFQKKVAQIKSDALQIPLFHTYAHGDTNLGNIFYDHISRQTAFIDLYALHRSIDINGLPIADPTIDLLRIEDSLNKKALKNLTDIEINELLDAFYAGYLDQGGVRPHKKHILFYKTYISMWKMILGSHYIDEKDPVRREFDKASFDQGLQFFKTIFP